MSHPRHIPFSLFGALSCALLCLVNGCSRTQPVAPTPTPVRVVVLSPGEELADARYAATIVPRAQVPLNFKSGGYVEAIAERTDARGQTRHLETGDAIKSGEALASVRQKDYADQVAQAEGQVALAQAAYDKAAADFARATKLLAAESMTQVQFDALKAAWEGAAATLKTARAVGEQALNAQGDSTLRAPFDGWVVQRNLEIGALIGPAVPAFVVADTHTVKVVFGVADSVVASIRRGEKITLSTASLSGVFEGEVTAVASSADTRSRLFTVEVVVPNTDNKLKPGMVATVFLNRGATSHALLTVPLASVVRASKAVDAFAVFVLSGAGNETVVHERQVTLGGMVGNHIAVTEGLEAGERVISQGGTDLKDGSRVVVVP